MKPFSFSVQSFQVRPAVADDVEEITRACQDSLIGRYTTLPVPYQISDAQKYVDEIAPKVWEQGGGAWVICQDGQLLAAISLVKRPDQIGHEVGYWCAPWGRGRGVITAVLAEVVELAFTRFESLRIVWRARVGNWASWKPAWRLGFCREGIERASHRTETGWADLWTASLLPGDLRKPALAWDGPGVDDVSGAVPPNPRDPEALVRQFHQVYNLPIFTGEATVDFERVHMRMGLILEEVTELVQAVYGHASAEAILAAFAPVRARDEEARDVIESADALADLIYVIYGMALECGINLPAVLANVQASNMSKLGSDGKPIYRADGKVLKGPGFFNPDVAGALSVRLTE